MEIQIRNSIRREARSWSGRQRGRGNFSIQDAMPGCGAARRVLLEQIPSAFIDSPKRENIPSAVTFVAYARGEDGEPRREKNIVRKRTVNERDKNN